MIVACIVQARMTSTRLPGKVMLPLAGEPVIRHVLRRCRKIEGVGRVVLAVPDSPASRPLEAEAMALDIACVRGPEHDVLARFHRAAMLVGADVVVRVTADCPLLDPVLCGDVLRPVLEGRAAYASNVLPRGYPKGMDCEAFTFTALNAAYRLATRDYDREHVTPWLQRNTLPRVNIDGPGGSLADLRLTLDTEEDYRFLSTIFERLPPLATDWASPTRIAQG